MFIPLFSLFVVAMERKLSINSFIFLNSSISTAFVQIPHLPELFIPNFSSSLILALDSDSIASLSIKELDIFVDELLLSDLPGSGFPFRLDKIFLKKVNNYISALNNLSITNIRAIYLPSSFLIHKSID